MNSLTGGATIDRTRGEYLDQIKQLDDAEREAARTFDKGILTLSAGALALSLTLLHYFPAGQAGWLLYMAWFGFIVSMLCSLASQLTSQRSIRNERQRLDRQYHQQPPLESNPARQLTYLLNWLSIVFFIIGVVCLAFFSAGAVIKEVPQDVR